GNCENGVTLPEPASVPGSAAEEPASVTTTAVSRAAAGTTPKCTARAPAASLMPAMPPAARPCGRTLLAAKCSSCASLETNTSSSSSALVAAPTTSSPSLSVITSQTSPFAGASPGTTRLTTPPAVPSASGGTSASSGTSASTRSPASSGTTSLTGTPPESEGAVPLGGIAGRSSTLTRCSRPRFVTAPTKPRAVVATGGRSTSCLLRASPSSGGAGGAASAVRASSPVADSSAQHGVSATSRG